MRVRLGRLGVIAGLTLSGCGGATYGGPQGNAGLTLPTPIAEGKPEGSDPPSAPPSAKRPRRAAPVAQPVANTAPPDPAPLRLTSQWEYSLRYDAGAAKVEAVRALSLREPLSTARRIGRFAIELWIGHELIDRVRFDFPLLGDPAPANSGPNLQAGVKSRVKVLVPASPRARRAVLVDRSNGATVELHWPPDEQP